MRESEKAREERPADVADMARALPEMQGLPLPPRPLAVVASVIAEIIENDGGLRESSDKTNRSER